MKHNIKKIHLLSWKQYPIGAFTEFFGKKNVNCWDTINQKLRLIFAVLWLKMCQCMNISIKNAIPSWKFSACDRSWSLIGRTTAPKKISLKARFPIKTFVTLLIFLFLMTMKMTRKLLTTAKIRIIAIQTRKMPASKVNTMVYKASCVLTIVDADCDSWAS